MRTPSPSALAREIAENRDIHQRWIEHLEHCAGCEDCAANVVKQVGDVATHRKHVAFYDRMAAALQETPDQQNEAERVKLVEDNFLMVVKQNLELDATVLALTAQRDELQAELARWKICENCGEPLVGPGICDQAITESQKNLELMHEETLTRAEQAEADVALLRRQLVHQTVPRFIKEG